MKLLLVDDGTVLVDVIADVLARQQYEVVKACNGPEALALARRERFDGMLMDVMLPGMDGLAVLRTLRSQGDPTPVMLLSSRCDIDDRVTGLDAGADDYLPKPFDMTELLARIRAMTRRPHLAVQRLSLGQVWLDEESSTLYCRNRSVPLSHLEMNLLSLLMRNSGIYFSAESLLEKVWGPDRDAEIGTVWVYISYLRKKLSTLNADIAIRSRRGVGYTLERT